MRAVDEFDEGLDEMSLEVSLRGDLLVLILERADEFGLDLLAICSLVQGVCTSRERNCPKRGCPLQTYLTAGMFLERLMRW